MRHSPGAGEFRLSRRTTVNIMLYIGVLAMAAVTYYDYRERNLESPSNAVLEAGAVLAVHVNRPGYPTLSLQKTDSDWTIISPINRAAIAQRVQALLSITRLDTESGYDLRELNRAELGLDTPLASVDLLTGEAAIHVSFGGLGPNNARRYLQIGQRVWLVDDIYLPLIESGLNAFAERGLLPTGKRVIRIVSPFSGATDSSDVLDQWQLIEAATITPIAQVALEQAAYVTLEFADGSVQPLKVARAGELIALLPEAADYALMLTRTQAIALGLVELN